MSIKQMNIDDYMTSLDRRKEVRKEIIKALSTVNRSGISQLIAYMDDQGFFEAPASTKHHHAYRGGLAQHSLEVLNYLRMELTTYNKDLFNIRKLQDTIIIVAILHDLCKVEDYVWSLDGTEFMSQKAPGHAKRSISLASRYIILTPEEKAAIMSHMGAYSNEVTWDQLSQNYRQFPISYALHVADMRSTYGLKGRRNSQ